MFYFIFVFLFAHFFLSVSGVGDLAMSSGVATSNIIRRTSRSSGTSSVSSDVIITSYCDHVILTEGFT